MIGRTHFMPRSHGHQLAGNLNYMRTSIGQGDNLQRSIVFLSIAGVFMVTGCILTGLGFPKLPRAHMAGPILMGLSLLLVMFAIREYFVFRQDKLETRRLQFDRTGVGALAALTVDSDDRLGAITFVMDTIQEPINEQTVCVEHGPPAYTQATPNIITAVMTQSHNVATVDEPPSYAEAIHGQHPSDTCPRPQTIVLTAVPGLAQSPVIPVTGYMVNMPIPRIANPIPPTPTAEAIDAADNNNIDGNNNTGQNYNSTNI